jgi:hypothetical protein
MRQDVAMTTSSTAPSDPPGELSPQPTSVYLTGDPEADALLDQNPNALLVGMVLDQQVPLEKAFSGPRVIASRMGGTFDVAAIAEASEEDFVALSSERPPSGYDRCASAWSRTMTVTSSSSMPGRPAATS